jgi:hypothetical protein
MVCTLAALVVSIACYRRHPSMRIFPYYIASSLLSDIIVCVAFLYYPGDFLLLAITSISRYAWVVFEFVALNLFILRSVGSPSWKRIIRINALAFFVLLILAILTIPYLHTHQVYYFTLQSAFLVPPCLIYFYRLFQTSNLRPLKDQPAFWVITGILFLKACSIPLLLTIYLMKGYEETVFTINYALYSLLFALLIRAYLCPPSNAQSVTPEDSIPVSA